MAGQIESALRRGLSVNPQRRWPFGDALLHEPQIRTTHGRATIAALTLALVCGWAAWPRPARGIGATCTTRQSTRCGAPRRARSPGRRSDRDGPCVVLGTIDDYVERWATAYVAVCVARAEGDESIVPLRAVSNAGARELQAVVAVLSTSKSEHRIDAGPVLDGLGPRRWRRNRARIRPSSRASRPSAQSGGSASPSCSTEIAECNALRAVGRTAEATTRADALAPCIAAVDWVHVDAHVTTAVQPISAD